MIRNTHVIVVANILLLLVNLYVLRSTLNQESDGNLVPRKVEDFDLLNQRGYFNYLSRKNDLNSKNQTDSMHLGEDILRTANLRITPSKISEKKRDRKYGDAKHNLPNEPVPDIYQTVFHNYSNPIKETNDYDWSLLRRGYRIPSLPRTANINCDALLAGSKWEMSVATDIMAQREFTKVPLYEEIYLEWTQECEAFKKNRGYITVPLTMEEEQFPIAFSISMFTDVEQMERLLRAVYQPHNVYCIHVDVKSSLLIHKTVRAIVNCFHNVFITSQISKVKWGDVSVLLPHLSCMKDLVKYYRGRWKYFIDLAGQEFPLRTNYEIVQILKIFNGSNDITASYRK